MASSNITRNQNKSTDNSSRNLEVTCSNGDINQNFLNERTNNNVNSSLSLQPQQMMQNVRGLNHAGKASPDSGWTFAHVINPKLIQQGLTSSHQANLHVDHSKKRSPNLQLPLLNFDSRYNNSALFQEAFQTKMMSPVLEMNVRQQQLFQQQQQIQQFQKSQAGFSNLLTPNGVYPSNPSLHDNNHQKWSQNFNNGPDKQCVFNGRRHTIDQLGSYSSVKQPITSTAESRTPDQSLPSFANFASSIPVVGSPQFQVALAAAQMKTYYSFLRKSGTKFPSPSNEDIGITNVVSSTNLTATDDSSVVPKLTGKTSNNKVIPKTRSNRPTLLGHLKSMDAVHNKGGSQYNYNTRSSHVSPLVESKDDKSSNPQRPNHLGFIPQTQLLSINVNNANDKGSTDSPGQNSPYSVASLQSNSPAGSDKGKNTRENVCPQCGKQFSSSSALAKHKLTHSDERKFVCHICSRGFKRQDHLNGHMITHRDKKPHQCHFQDCGKSYCDMRSLRRHLENHHSSPPGGTTPASYMPKLMLYPGCSEQDLKNQGQQPPSSSSDNHLDIPHDPPRPSSAPLVPPEPKRITRTRRSSSGEETHLQLDPAMLREIEHYKQTNPYHQQGRGSEEYIKPRDERTSLGSPPQLTPAVSTHLLKPVSSTALQYDHLKIKHAYEHSPADSQQDGRHRYDYDKHFTSGRDAGKPSVPSATNERRDYESKSDYPSISYATGLPPRISSSYPWPGHQQSQTRPPPSSGNMPYLLNIRPPYPIPHHAAYASPNNDDARMEAPKLSKSEIEARHQAVSTYLQMWANGQHSNLTPEQLFMYPPARLGQHLLSQHRPTHPPTPTDPISIAVATAKEPTDRHHYNVRDGLYAHPVNAKWQPVMKDDSVTIEKEKKTSFYHTSQPPASTAHDGYIKRPPVSHERNIIDEPFKPSETNHKYSSASHNNNARYYGNHSAITSTRDYGHSSLESRQHASDRPRSPQRYEAPPKIFEPPHLRVDSPDNIASALSPNKKRPRPGPIIIPPAVNNRAMMSISPSKGFPGFPKGIYTPPAMLSPRSIFFNPPNFGPRAPPHTPMRMHVPKRLSIDHRETTPQVTKTTTPSSEEPTNNNNNEETPETPEPKINVGPDFQAVLPHVLNRTEAQKDIHRASLMWSPLKEDEQKHEEVEAYLDMACSLVLYGGSNNKEYALHILQRTRGNVKEAVRLLLSRRHILRADDPNADYHYSGSVRWTAKERLAFRQAYRTKGKVFIDIQKEIGTKNVQQCVEFYYLWKAMHPESFRARTRMVEVESEQDDEEVPPTPTAAVAPLSTLREPVFECDYPECRARFVSRQALNGHIRVHGGSLSKPLDTRRTKVKSELTYSIDGFVSPPKKKKSQPDSVIMANTPDGPMPQFQCKVCGRVFSKVKSRSAHMKTHVKRDENNKPIKQAKQSKQKQHQQQPPTQPHLLQPPSLHPPTPNQPPQPHPSSMNPMTVYAHA